MVLLTGRFFEDITTQYGFNSTRLLKSWMSIRRKLCMQKQQLTFLLRCRKYEVLPPHICNLRFNIAIQGDRVKHKFNVFKKRSQKTILNLEIKNANVNLKFLKSKITKIEEKLFMYLPPGVVNSFFMFNKRKINTYNDNCKHKLINKFNNIRIKQKVTHNFLADTDILKWIVNISNEQIPDSVLRFLSLGDRFALPFNKKKNAKDRVDSVVGIIKNFENYCCKLDKKVADSTHNAISNVLTKFLNTDKHK